MDLGLRVRDLGLWRQGFCKETDFVWSLRKDYMRLGRDVF